MNASYDPLYLFIDGKWLEADGRDTASVVNPATQRELGRVPLATAADLDLALEVAQRAFEGWRHTVPAERARILKRAADLMRERAVHIATLMTLEEGKPLAESSDEVLRAADYFEWFAEEARRIDGRVVPSNRPGVQQLTVLADVPMDARVMNEEPFGPIAVLMPFDTLADGLAEANRLPYGLSAYAFTGNARTAVDVADGLEAGMIGINQYRIVSTELPFGGMKESGHGSEGGTEGIGFYLTNKFISQI
jgi:acyl-CoA reductase-like NAD-dependent aldehyde dehydrogenase